MTTKAPLRVFFIVDGYTLKKANDYYRLYHPCHTPLDFRAIKNWARKEALRLFTPVSRYAQMQCHYYHPYKDPQMYCHSHGISCLERELRYTGFQIHYCEQIGPDGVKPNMSLMEDVMMFATYSRMDALVLLSSQRQFAPLPEKLSAMGIKTLLMGWNFQYVKNDRNVVWKTDRNLKENATFYVAMDCVAEGLMGIAGSGLFCAG
jgi:hypothetical protein